MKRDCAKCGNPFDMPDDATDIVDALTDESKGSGPMCPTCFKIWQIKNPPPAEVFVPQKDTKYLFTDDMGEISGFGGGYEQTCRNMLAAGLEWFDANADADPHFKGFEGVYGILADDNDDAKALSAAVCKAGDGCSGAMHQATIGHCLFVRKNGWDRYCEELRQRESDEATP